MLSALSAFAGVSTLRDHVSSTFLLSVSLFASSRSAWLWLSWIRMLSQLARRTTAQAFEASRQGILKAAALFNSHLATRTYTVGNQITAADIVIAAAFVPVLKEVSLRARCLLCDIRFSLSLVACCSSFAQFLPSSKHSEFGNLVRWFETCVNQKHFAAVLGARLRLLQHACFKHTHARFARRDCDCDCNRQG